LTSDRLLRDYVKKLSEEILRLKLVLVYFLDLLYIDFYFYEEGTPMYIFLEGLIKFFQVIRTEKKVKSHN